MNFTIKLLASAQIALLCSCGTATHQAPANGSPSATIHNEIASSMTDGKFHRVTAIDGKKVHSWNNRWPIHVAPGNHRVTLQASYIGFGVPGSPLKGNTPATLNLQSGGEYNLTGKRVSNHSEMWLEETRGGKRVSPVFRAPLETVQAGPPTMIFL